MTKDEALRLALEALKSCNGLPHWPAFIPVTDAIKAALEANDKPVGLIESLKDAQPCCGQYETCWRACTPRGKFIGQRDAQRNPLTDDEIKEAVLDDPFGGLALLSMMRDEVMIADVRQAINRIARAIESAHGITGDNNG